MEDRPSPWRRPTHCPTLEGSFLGGRNRGDPSEAGAGSAGQTEPGSEGSARGSSASSGPGYRLIDRSVDLSAYRSSHSEEVRHSLSFRSYPARFARPGLDPAEDQNAAPSNETKRLSDAGLGPKGRGLKNVSRLGAALVFVDESGLLLAPLMRRTWVPCGQTPLLLQ